MRPPREDTKPWYRQFWPWFLIALPGSVVVASMVTIWLAASTSDSETLAVPTRTGRPLAWARAISSSRAVRLASWWVKTTSGSSTRTAGRWVGTITVRSP